MSRWCCLVGVFAIAMFVMQGDAEESVGGHPCNSEALQKVSCANPGRCLNACAFHCPSRVECYMCCAAFYGTQAYSDCRKACDDVWTPPA